MASYLGGRLLSSLKATAKKAVAKMRVAKQKNTVPDVKATADVIVENPIPKSVPNLPESKKSNILLYAGIAAAAAIAYFMYGKKAL